MRSGKTSAVLSLLAALAAPGCCGPRPPPPEKFFNRKESPVETLKGFVYAVDTYQWDFAHACLSARSREEISPFKLEVALRFLKDPVYGEVDLFDVISSSVTRRGAPRYDREGAERKWATTAWIRVISAARRPDGTRVEFDTDLSFVKEDGEWRFDFVGTIDAIQQALSAQTTAS